MVFSNWDQFEINLSADTLSTHFLIFLKFPEGYLIISYFIRFASQLASKKKNFRADGRLNDILLNSSVQR